MEFRDWSTLAHFCGSRALLNLVERKQSLRITNLKKLTKLNGMTFKSLPKAMQLNFQLRPIRVTTLNDKSDFSVRYDLFERLNTGGVKLHAQEIRNCVFRGGFRDLLKELSTDKNFRKVVKLADNEQQTAIYEECVLRFFSFLEEYKLFDHSVVEFLNDYMIKKNKNGPKVELVTSFRTTMAWLAEELRGGIARGTRSITPLNLFEAVAVGTALALKENKRLEKGRLKRIMDSEELRKLTTGATNSQKMVSGRILYVYNNLLA